MVSGSWPLPRGLGPQEPGAVRSLHREDGEACRTPIPALPHPPPPSWVSCGGCAGGWGWVGLLPTRNPDLPLGPTAMPWSLGLSKGRRPYLQHEGSEWERERGFLRAWGAGLMVRRAMSFLRWTYRSPVLNDWPLVAPTPSWPLTAQVSRPPSLLRAGETATLPQSRGHRWGEGSRGCSGRGGGILLPSWNCGVSKGGKGCVLLSVSAESLCSIFCAGGAGNGGWGGVAGGS